jgi:hypothetical protein
MLRQKFTLQVTTLPDCDDITRFDGTWQSRLRVASTHTRWLVHYLAVEAEGGLYAHQVAGEALHCRRSFFYYTHLQNNNINSDS